MSRERRMSVWWMESSDDRTPLTKSEEKEKLLAVCNKSGDLI